MVHIKKKIFKKKKKKEHRVGKVDALFIATSQYPFFSRFSFHQPPFP